MVPLLFASSVSSSRVVAGSDGAFLVGIAFLPGLFDVAFFFRSGSTGNGIFIFIIIIIDIGICHDDELGDITQLCRLEIVLGDGRFAPGGEVQIYSTPSTPWACCDRIIPH